MLLSTGMSDLHEVAAAVEVVRTAGARELALFHCTSAYPAPLEAANLRAIITMRRAFDVPVGFSDHTLGSEVPLAAIAVGAELLEKHITLDRTLPGPDHAASMEPAAFAELVRALRRTERALGDGAKIVQDCEREVQRVARRSLFAARALPEGHVLQAADLVARRPASGLSPSRISSVLGRALRRGIAADAPLAEEDLA
jgi:N-acetylneuraminate synthase/N,N'-diacetyllegionaminate synthase